MLWPWKWPTMNRTLIPATHLYCWGFLGGRFWCDLYFYLQYSTHGDDSFESFLYWTEHWFLSDTYLFISVFDVIYIIYNIINTCVVLVDLWFLNGYDNSWILRLSTKPWVLWFMQDLHSFLFINNTPRWNGARWQRYQRVIIQRSIS